jgi:hypothetical protein
LDADQNFVCSGPPIRVYRQKPFKHHVEFVRQIRAKALERVVKAGPLTDFLTKLIDIFFFFD